MHVIPQVRRKDGLRAYTNWSSLQGMRKSSKHHGAIIAQNQRENHGDCELERDLRLESKAGGTGDEERLSTSTDRRLSYLTISKSPSDQDVCYQGSQG